MGKDGGMLNRKWLILFVLFCMVVPVSAEIYHFVDEKGIAHFTNIVGRVPAEYLSAVVRYPEYQSVEIDSKNQAPSLETEDSDYEEDHQKSLQADNERNDAIYRAALKKQKQKLISEYESLRKEKEKFENNKSYQKRSIKRRYRNRPYILRLNEEVRRLNARIENYDRKRKAFYTVSKADDPRAEMLPQLDIFLNKFEIGLIEDRDDR
jgi:hypothetical protein